MKLIAQKPCSFGGKQFYIGNEIPVKDVLNPTLQAKLGVLAIVPDDAGATPPAVETMTVVIRAEEGDLPLNLTAEGLQAVVDVFTSNVEDAEPVIAAMTDGDALILLHIADNRKAIKTAAEARAKALNEATEDTEETEEESEETEETEEETEETTDETEESAGEQ